MPTYDYVCDACGHAFELFQSMTAKHEKTCPECRKRKLRRLIGMGAAILVGGSSSSRSDGPSGSDSESGDASAAKDSDSTPTKDSTGTDATEPKAGSSDESKKSDSSPDPPEKRISGSTSTPTHEAREGRGVGNLVDAARRQRRDTNAVERSKKTETTKKPTKKSAGKTSKSKPAGGSAAPKASKPAPRSRKPK
jgi:putative FmdB family regulatory protein